MSLFDSGIRPAIDDYLAKKAAEVRDYGDYWSASSAGYCMRKVMFERLKVPQVEKDGDARKQRVFEAGHIFHEWAQRITKNAGISIAQELELQDEDLMIRGHIDDLVLVPGPTTFGEIIEASSITPDQREPKLILYDYKTQNSKAFSYQKGRPISYFHKMQLGTYMYMLRRYKGFDDDHFKIKGVSTSNLTEARILKISKDDLRMSENQLMWSEELEAEVLAYWNMLNEYWKARKLPPCTCADQEGGFMAKELYNPFWFEGEPCSLEWLKLKKAEGLVI